MGAVRLGLALRLLGITPKIALHMLTRIYKTRWARAALAGAAGGALLLSALAPAAQAAALTQSQINAVVSLLTAFGVDATTIGNVEVALGGASVASTTSMGATTPITAGLLGYLHRGDHGKSVCYLHAALAADPSVSSALTASDTNLDCWFGPLTEDALKHFQSAHGLESVGFIGPKTLAALQAFLSQNQLGTEDDNNASTTASGGHGRICAIVPPGHLIAPGWLRKHSDDRPVVPECQTLPPGITMHLGEGEGDEHHGGNGTTTPPAADTTPPVISSVSASSVGSTTATVSWATNEAASSKVYYATSTPLDFTAASMAANASLVTSHALDLSGLMASSTYYYAVTSADAAGNTATSSTGSFMTE